MTIDNKKNIKAIQQKAELGDAEAQFKLGRLHFYGEKPPWSFQEAYIWLFIAKKNGCAHASGYTEAIAKHFSRDPSSHIENFEREAERRYADIQRKKAGEDNG